MSDLTPVNVVCHRIADRPAPSVDSTAERCIQCTAPVWLSLATAAAIERMGRTSDARVFCVTCAKPALKNTIAVLSSGHVSTGEAGRAARAIGVPAGTPIIDLDRRRPCA